jgi:glycosyltransferase involved in cell wall biosynthesis
MSPGPHHQVADLRRAPGELSFEARVGGRTQRVWMRTETPVLPTADAALAATAMPAMRLGGTLELAEPVSPRLLRTQREFQAIQRGWSWDWEFGDPPLHEVEVVAPVRRPPEPAGNRVAAFFSGGVDSWSTVLMNPDVTDLIFVREGFDFLPHLAHQAGLAGEVEARLRSVAEELGLPLHVVETNLRELSDPLIRWEAFCACAAAAVALFLGPLFERVLIATDTDHATQPPIGPGRMVNQLWSTERLEIVDDGGRLNRPERVRAIAGHPIVQRSLRVCWENFGGAYNCGRCRKCVLTMITLEAYGMRDRMETFPPDLDLDLLAGFEIGQRVSLAIGEDVLDTVRTARRPDLEHPVEDLIARGRRALGIPGTRRGRHGPGPPPTIRLAVVVPAWRQARYLAGAARSALDQEIICGVGVVVVNDGCPDPETERIGQTLRDAHPDRVAYLSQPNRGVSAARNAGIRQALARWPHVEAIFPLDADNLLSPHTLARLSALLEEHPEAAWASPTLEFFGAEQGEWQIPGPYLPYRQLFANQSDTGSLIRRTVFEAGIFYDETVRYGFEDWELFLRATLAGFRGFQAGRCGFRYRRRPESMLAEAMERKQRLAAEIRSRHRQAYEPGELIRREHAEAPRFALVRCDRDDVLLTASCDLEPRRLALAAFARSLAAAGDDEPSPADHVPAVTVLTTAATIDRLGAAGLLAEALFRLQTGLRGRAAVGLRVGPASTAGPAALAIRAAALDRLSAAGGPQPEALVEVDPDGAPGEPLPQSGLSRAAALIGAAVQGEGMPLPAISHPSFFERLHIDEQRTTFPSSAGAEVA